MDLSRILTYLFLMFFSLLLVSAAFAQVLRKDLSTTGGQIGAAKDIGLLLAIVLFLWAYVIWMFKQRDIEGNIAETSLKKAGFIKDKEETGSGYIKVGVL